MASNVNGKVQNWFTVDQELSKDVVGNTEINVKNISAVAFADDVDITFGTVTSPFTLPANTPIGIDYRVNTISVDIDTFMFAMER